MESLRLDHLHKMLRADFTFVAIDYPDADIEYK
jgi:hypothetical protein